MALTRVTSGGIAPGVVIKFDSNDTPTSPAINFIDSPETGIYSPANNELAFATAGVERLRFKSDGSVITGNGTILGGTNPDFDNSRNVVLYVNQSDKNSTDAVSNDGGNINQPFKTIERALLEAARKSYVSGANNDKFEAYTIMVLPGDYIIDNRPGYDITSNPLIGVTNTGSEFYRFNPRNGGLIVPRGTSIVGYDLRKTVIRPKYVPLPISNDGSITDDNYVISGVMYDAANMLEKARGYVVEQAFLYAKQQYPSISQINETCKRDIGYIVDAVIADLREGGNANSFIVGEFYTDGTALQHITGTNEKAATIVAFERARNVMISAINLWNNANIPTEFRFVEITSDKTVTRPTFTTNVDYSTGNSYDSDCSTAESAINTLIGIVTGIIQNPDTYTTLYKKTLGVAFQTSIFKVTGGCYFWQMTFKDALIDNPLDPNNATPNTIPSVSYNSSGVPTFSPAVVPNYSHNRVVAFSYADQRTTDGELDRYYQRIDAWAQDLGELGTREVRREEYEIVGDVSRKTTIDTVNSCSPYIFNCSLRSVFGLCGMHTDGSKVKENSFKSMVVAQFTGISLQRDSNAYWQPWNKTGKVYTTSSATLQQGDLYRNIADADESATNRGPIYADPDSEYKHDWRHFHIKASNGAFIQVVSVFAVGYADQFLAVNGGDMSITNSNSNFGQISLRAAGHKFKSDPPSAYGKITAIIPPSGINPSSQFVEIYPIAARDTWEANLGVTATKVESDWSTAKTRYSTAGNNLFKLYLEIPGVQSEDDIPELVVETIDQNTGQTLVKRFLTYGASNNYNMFREYYNSSGILTEPNCKIVNQVDSTSGGLSTYEAIVDIDANANETGKNKDRVGYFWDRSRQKVYLQLDSSYTATQTYIRDFVFASTVETSFVTETVTNPDGSATVVSRTQDVNVLRYWEGFPGSITSPKLVDARASSPNDLLWRVKYVIPRNYKDPSGKILTPKAPEKRFIIKGTSLNNDPDGIPYTNYRFTIWDVEEIQTWERDVRDGEYYLTILRADIDKFIDGEEGSGFENTAYVINRDDNLKTVIADNLTELSYNDKNYRVSSNVNYLFPSTNEEGNITNPLVIWNPPQTDSRVVAERLGATGLRPKDVSVPNRKYYNSSISSTPFYEVPALASVTAEACHRLVRALDLCYIRNSSTTTTNVSVSPVASWDSRSGSSGYSNISTTFRIYGTVTNGYRYGSGTSVVNSTVESSTTSINIYGISGPEEERKIPVCSRLIFSSNLANVSHDANGWSGSGDTATHAVYDVAPIVPLHRPSILRASSHTWEYIGIGPGNYSTGFPNLQTRVLKAYEQFIAQGYENSGGFVASSGTNSAGDFYIGNQVIQAGGQSTTTLNVPKVRKSSESNAVDNSDIENRISNNVINVIASTNKSSAQQNLLKGLSNFFTTARLTVSDRANIQTLYVTDRMFIANNRVLNGEKFPEGGPEGFGFTRGARPEKTGFIATDTNDRLYVSPKFLDAWRIKKKILSASNINLDNNRIYIEPLSRTFISSLQNDSSNTVAFTTPLTFTGNIVATQSGTVGTISNITFTGLSTGKTLANLYEGMKVAVVSGSAIVGEAKIDSITSTNIVLTGADFISANGVSFYTVDKLTLVDTSGIPPFGRIDIEMSLELVTAEDYILDGQIKKYLNPTINISLQYDEVDYTTNSVFLTSDQNYSPYSNYVASVLPKEDSRQLHTIIRNYTSILPVITNDVELQDFKYLQGTISANVSSTIVDEQGTNSIATTSTQITVNSDFWNKLPSRGAVTLRFSSSGTIRYSTFIYFKDATLTNKICLLRRVTTQSNNDTGYTYSSETSKIFFTGCRTFASYGDKWTVENAFIPDVEEISEDVDIESATLYTLPIKPVPYTGRIDLNYTESIVPNPVTSKALGANLQTKRTVKTFQPFENLKQVADFAKSQGFTANDEVELLIKPGYYRLYSNTDSEYNSRIEFPCRLKINGSGVRKTDEQYSKELANGSAGRIGGYSLTTVKSGDSVSFYRSPQFRNNWGGRTDLLYVSNINDTIYSTGGLNIENVHFLGLNESITRNEILDNAYSDDSFTIAARRKVRKAWYVKQSKGFPVSEAGIEGGLSFQAFYSTASSNNASFTYYVNTYSLTDSSRVPVDPTVNDTTKISKDARYVKITFTSSDFANIQRFRWITEYVIPGTTLYYFPNASSQVITSSTKRTRVLDVRKNISNGVITSFDIFVATFDPTSDNSNGDEDMDLITGVSTLQNGIQCVFVNRDGDEFVTLTYNWCKEKRNELLPSNFTTSGEGFDPEKFDEPRIYGIIAGYKTNTLNLVIDTHPTAEIGGVRSFTRSGSAAGIAVNQTYPAVTASGGSGSGASFNVTVSNGVFSSITIANNGTGYKVGEQLTILGTSIGGTTANNITLTIGTVNPDKRQYPAYTLFNYYPSAVIKIDDNNEEFGFTIPVFPNGFRRLFGRQDTRYYLLEIDAADVGALNDNNGHNSSVDGQFSGFSYSDIRSDEPGNITVGSVTFTETDRRRTTFLSDQQFEAIAKYNLSQSGTGYRESGSGLNTIGRKIYMNYSQRYKVNRKKFPTSAAPVVGNLGSTLIKVTGIPGTSNLVRLTNVTIGAMSDANDQTNTYGGNYHGGIIAIENGQVDLRGVRFRGNLSLDWSGLLTDNRTRLSAENKFTYGHSVDLIETSGIIAVSGIGDNTYRELNVSKEDINFKYYTMFSPENNLFIEPNKLPTGKPVDYDTRTFPITTINAIPKFSGTGFNTNVILNERFLTNKIVTESSGTNVSGLNLRYNNSSQLSIISGVDGGHSDPSQNLEPKTVTFTLPYTTPTEKEEAELLAKNIYPNFTSIIRSGNPDSVLATVTNFKLYNKTEASVTTAYFTITYSGNIEYENQQNTTTATFAGGEVDFSEFELQFLTKYIPSQRFNYLSTLTTRYIKRSNADGTKYSKYEIGFDTAQRISIFAVSKDFEIVKVGSGKANISRGASGEPNIISFTNTTKTTESESEKLKVILETNALGDILSCDVVTLGLNNNPDEVLRYFPTAGDTTNYYQITMAKSTRARTSSTDIDYEMFEPGEVVAAVENSAFIVNNFTESSLTGIKASLQRVKSIIAPGNYIEYGGQYYKIASSEPGRPYLGIYQYVNPSNRQDVRTSLVIRLEEKTYSINYSRTRNGETVTRFDLYEDDNILKYWPDSGRLEIGDLELCDFTKKYIDTNTGYRITLTRSNTNFWPSYIHDWDGLEIVESFTASSDPTNPAVAPPQVATGRLRATTLKLADPVDVTCSTYKRVDGIGYTELATPYMSKTGILTNQRAYIDITSGNGDQDADINKFEVGQIVSLPWRNISIGPNDRASNDSRFDVTPASVLLTVDSPRGTGGTSGSTNREGDNIISVIISNSRYATADISNLNEFNDGIARLPSNFRNPHQFVNISNTWSGNRTSHSIYDKVDPLSVCRTIIGVSQVLGKPNDVNNTVTVSISDRVFTLSQNGNANVGIGITPRIVVKHPNLPKETLISRVTVEGTAPNKVYTITINKSPLADINGTVTFTNEIYTDLELFHPIMQTFNQGDTFRLAPAFNSEGHPWNRHTEIFTSRIADIQKVIVGGKYLVRLHLSDPFTYGNPDGNANFIDPRFITHENSRYFGFISVNHGGYSFPRSGGSYFPSNTIKLTSNLDQIKIPNYSDRIKSGDTLKYTYEANTVVQEINLSRVSDGNRSRLRLRNIAVQEGDSLVGFTPDAVNKFGVKDIYRENGTYTVYHVKYEIANGSTTDNYRFGSTATNSFWNSTTQTFSTQQPLTRYVKDGTTYYVDIGAGVTLGPSQSYTGLSGSDASTALNADRDLGVYTGTGENQNTSDAWVESLVRTNGGGVGAELSLTVSGNEITGVTIVNGGSGYRVNDWILIRGAVFNFNNPRYSVNVYLYVSDITSGGAIASFTPRILLTNVQDSSDVIQIGYNTTFQKWFEFPDPSDSSAETLTSTELSDQNAIFIDTVEGSFVYFKAQLTDPSTNELREYRVEFIGGLASGQKVIFAKPKPSAKLVSGTVVSVGTPDSDGYSTVTIDSPDNILYTSYPNPNDWLSVGDVLVSHSSDLFANDGSVVLRFMHSETGGSVEFNNFQIWNDWYQNGSQNKGFGVFGSHGWVGNWGRTVDGVRPIGLSSIGALNINWGRQRGNSIWKVAQPIRPVWTHIGTTTNVIYNGAAFSPAFRYFYTNGTNTFFSSSLVNYLMEDKQVFDSIGYANVIQHVSNTTDSIKLKVSTQNKYLRDDWWSGRYYEGGFGPLSYEPYQWSSTFDSISTSRIVNKNKISYQLQDLRFRSNDNFGNINWGSGFNTRLTEFMVADYVQHYSLGPIGSDANGGSYFVNTGVTVTNGATTAGNYWQHKVLSTSPSTSGNKNIRQGRTVTTPVSGRRYIVGASTNPSLPVGILWTATGTTLPSGVTSLFDYESKIARGDAIYLSNNNGVTKIFVGFARFIGGGAGNNDDNLIYLTQALPIAQQSGNWSLYYVRVNGLLKGQFESAYSQTNDAATANLKGDNVLSASMPGSLDYNLSFVIDKRNYNTSPILNTVGSVKPVGNFWWDWGSTIAHRSIRSQFGDLSAFNWSLMNINITRFNPKVHLESTVTVTSAPSSIAVTNVFI